MPRLDLRATLTGARQLAEEVVALTRLTRDLPGFLRTPIDPKDATIALDRRLANRQERLLRIVEHGIYANPGSPFARLLRHAGCELGDFEGLVCREGIEGALSTLADRGVYVTYDELKGRREAVRGSQRFAFRDRDFDNPLMVPHFPLYTGGTAGRPSRVWRSLFGVAEVASTFALAYEAHGLHDPEHVLWLTSPINKLLTYAKLGQSARAWLHPLSRLPAKAHLGGAYLQAVGRASGYLFPRPTYLDLQQPERLVAWLAQQPRKGPPLIITTTVSSAVRAAVAARAAGLALDHVTFQVQGEPITPARHAHITACGARVLVTYGAGEIMTIGLGCAMPTAVDDVHLTPDQFITTAQARAVFDDGPVVDVLRFTTVSPHASKLVFNADLGDYGQLVQRDCGCALGSLGLRTHLSNVRSFEKLTGEGMTFVRGDLVRIIEESLPARFGGSSADYQFLEEIDAGGATRLVLRIDPAVPGVRDECVRATLLDELRRGTVVNAFMADLWRRAGTITIVRKPPRVTAAGKSLPIHLLKPAAPG